MKSDFYTAIAQIAAERGIPREAVLSSVEHALKTVYRKMAGTEEEVQVEMESSTGNIRIYVIKSVVSDVEDDQLEISIEEARKTHPDAVLGDTVRFDRTPQNFGRIAAHVSGARFEGDGHAGAAASAGPSALGTGLQLRAQSVSWPTCLK